MFGKSGASAKNCIWSVALTQWHMQKQLSSNSKRRRRTRWKMVSSASSGTAWTFTIRATGTGVRQSFAPTPRNSRSRSRALITHRTSQKAELFCEIRMMRPGCGCHRKTCDGRLLLRAFPEIADTTGGRSAQKTNFSIAILLTESLHQFA
jgi:hypothetical protein